MEECSRKIEELLKKKGKGLRQVSSDVDCDKRNNDINSNNNYCMMKNLLNNVVDIVKLTNKITYNSLYNNDDIDMLRNNNVDIKNLQKDLLNIVYDLLHHSSNEMKQKELVNIKNDDNCNFLKDNYHIISSTLEEIYFRIRHSVLFFHKDIQVLTDNYNKNDYNTNNDISSERNNNSLKTEYNNICETKFVEENKNNNILNHHIINKEKNDNIQLIKKKAIKDEQKIYVNDEDVVIIKDDDHDDIKKLCDNTKLCEHEIMDDNNHCNDILVEENKKRFNNSDIKTKKDINKNNVKNYHNNNNNNIKENKPYNNINNVKMQKNIKQMKKDKKKKNNKTDMEYFKEYSNKIQNMWLHLTNNYSKCFIPRILFKYNKLVDLEYDLIEAVKWQEDNIKKKLILLNMQKNYENGELENINSNDIINKIFDNNNNNNNMLDKDINHETFIEDDKYSEHSFVSSDISLSSFKDDVDKNLFHKLLKKLNKEINKYCYKFNNLNHPYKYEIENIIKEYRNDNNNVTISNFLQINMELKKLEDINKKAYKIIDNKNDLINMINNIKLNYQEKKISIMIKVNYKRTYRGFTSIIMIGTNNMNYIIDVFNMFEDLYVINDITTDPNILKITYNAPNIINQLQKDFSIYFVNIFDIAICSSYLNFKNNLNYLIYKYFNTVLYYKNKILQNVLITRPIEPDMVDVIQNEFSFLYDLFDYIKIDIYFNYIFNTNKMNNSAQHTQIQDDTVDAICDNQAEYHSKDEQIQTSKDEEDTKPFMNKQHIYVNFETLKFSDISEEEKKHGEQIIRKIFIESNLLCHHIVKLKDVCNIEKTKNHIKNIVNTSYNIHACDNLIYNILYWREELAKKIDETPDSIINIHNIISILLNMSTTLSSLKNNIIPLSNIISENLETLLEIIIKSNIYEKKKQKKKEDLFYFNYINNQNINIHEEENNINLYTYNKNNNLYTHNCVDSVILTNVHFDYISKEQNMLDIQNDTQNDTLENQETKEAHPNIYRKNSFLLEQTLFSDDEIDKSYMNNINYIQNLNFIKKNIYLKQKKSSPQPILIDSNKSNYVDNLNSNDNYNENIKKNSVVKKTIDKNIHIHIHNNNNKKKDKHIYQSYNQQYNIKKTKGLYSKNILSEIDRK
ncbi:exosome complex exonuclease RRP6, putative [Plasmodium reichenowi]|uniref:Exosome complex exonuclease RRP6, putative n=1 Tax=Plasmodium reichenowi TaxID=5854 RepID=A0A151L5L9_PLARE|nr:exosome complex exonuclease RRP6, putative [Plasmodium reichenowi]KYN94147.1 exosome complex exonuclease RRP6, putative [Plasmodium reichenowi]